jgi:hypothetical protein
MLEELVYDEVKREMDMIKMRNWESSWHRWDECGNTKVWRKILYTKILTFRKVMLEIQNYT